MVTSEEGSNGSNAHLNEAATPGPSEDWPSETDIIYPTGSNKIMLTVQRPLLKAVFQDAFERIHAAMVFHNAFPNAYQTVEMITESLITAAKLNDRATNIHNRLIVDGDYSTCRILSLALVRMHACMRTHSPDQALFLFYLSSFLLLYIARSLSSLDLSSLSFYTARSSFFISLSDLLALISHPMSCATCPMHPCPHLLHFSFSFISAPCPFD